MRTLTIGFLTATTLGCLSTARAADLDYDYLRGPEYEPVTTQIIDWSGAYVGGHGGYSSSGSRIKNVFASLSSSALNNIVPGAATPTLTLGTAYEKHSGSGSFGALAGYNYQIDEAVIGIEFDYTHSGQSNTIRDGISGPIGIVAGDFAAVAVTGSSSTRLDDYGTIRARAGYALGDILPYVTGGVAIGSARITDSVIAQPYTVAANSTTAVAGTPKISSQSKTDVVVGFALGAGIEYAFTSNIIVRGEYQYISFDKLNGHYFDINTVRGGATYKF